MKLNAGYMALFSVCMLMGASQAAEQALKPNAVFGEWQLVGASVNVPPACRHSRLLINPDSVDIRTGQPLDSQFSFHSRMSLQQAGNVYVLHLSQPVHNNQPDCQGNAARDIMKHFNDTRYLQVNGDRLYHYLGPDSSAGYLRYQRVGVSGARAQ